MYLNEYVIVDDTDFICFIFISNFLVKILNYLHYSILDVALYTWKLIGRLSPLIKQISYNLTLMWPSYSKKVWQTYVIKMFSISSSIWIMGLDIGSVLKEYKWYKIKS